MDILLISPERLANDTFRSNVLQRIANRVGLFVVDEAHCISDWGHDFRPDYRRIVRVLRALPRNIPVLATTATANNRVVGDIAAQLGDLQVQRGPLRRESLILQNIELPSPAARMAWLVENLPHMEGSGIIYTLTIRDAERVASWLRYKGIRAEAYHSDSGGGDEGRDRREELEDMLLTNRVKALVATVALGMGFDKPDLGFVIHFQRPGSVVHYYQQVGRAGRAISQAYGILLCGAEDDDITDYFIRSAFPPQNQVDQILKALDAARDGLSVPTMETLVNLRRNQIDKVLKVLSVENPSPIVKQGSRWYTTPVEYKPDQERIDRLTAIRRAEQRDMMDYISSRECLMAFLAQKLDDPQAGPCGQCANCRISGRLSSAVQPGTVKAARLFLRRSHQRIKPRKAWPPGNAFPLYGFRGRIKPDLQALEGRALSIWNDAGWGAWVKAGKFENKRFADELVEACAQMIGLWRPTPPPQWVACVPSLKFPELLPDFARRLAGRLNLPFVRCLEKVKDNPPQSAMVNSFQQARNLDGVFEIESGRVGTEPVLLVDDLVYSGWTFTVAAALARRAGCSHVHPVALALTIPGME